MKVKACITSGNEIKGYIINDEGVDYPIDIKFILYKHHYVNLTKEGYSINKETGEIKLDDTIESISFNSLPIIERAEMSKPYPESDTPMEFTVKKDENLTYDYKVKKPEEILIKSREELLEMMATGVTPKGKEGFINPNSYISEDALFEKEELDSSTLDYISMFLGRLLKFSDLKEFIENNKIEEVSVVNIYKKFLEYGIPFIKGSEYNINVLYLNNKEANGFKIPLLDSPASPTGIFPAIGRVVPYESVIFQDDLKTEVILRRNNTSQTILDIRKQNAELYSDSVILNTSVITSADYILSITTDTGVCFKLKSGEASINDVSIRNPKFRLGKDVYNMEICYALRKELPISDYIYAKQLANSMVGDIKEKLLEGKEEFNTYNIYSAMGISPESCISIISKYYLEASNDLLAEKGISKLSLISMSSDRVMELYSDDEDILDIYSALVRCKMVKADISNERFLVKLAEFDEKIRSGNINTSEIISYINSVDRNLNSLNNSIIALCLSKEIDINRISDYIEPILKNPKEDTLIEVPLNKSRLIIQYYGQQPLKDWCKQLLHKKRIEQIYRGSSVLYIDEILFETGKTGRHVGIIGRQFGMLQKGGYTTKDQSKVITEIERTLTDIYEEFYEDSKLLKLNVFFVVSEALKGAYDKNSYTTKVGLSFDITKPKHMYDIKTELLNKIRETSVQVIEDTASITSDLITYDNVYCYCINATVTPYAVVPKAGYDIPANPINLRATIDKSDDIFQTVIEKKKMVPPYRTAILRTNPLSGIPSGTPLATISLNSSILKYIYTVTRKDEDGNYVEQKFIEHPYDVINPEYKDSFTKLELEDRGSNPNKYIRTSQSGYIMRNSMLGLDQTDLEIDDSEGVAKALRNFFIESVKSIKFTDKEIKVDENDLMDNIPVSEICRLDVNKLLEKLCQIESLKNTAIYKQFAIIDGKPINYKDCDNSNFTVSITGNVKAIRANGEIKYFMI